MRLNRQAESRLFHSGRSLTSRVAMLAILMLLALSPVLATHVPVTAAQEADVPSGRVIVVLSDQVQLAEQTELAEEVDASVTFGSVLNGFAAELTPAEAAELADNPNVIGIYPDLPIYLAEEITVSLGVRRIGAPASNTDLSQGLPPAVNATVAVIDSGVSLSHPNLNVVAGFDAWSAAEPTSGVTNCGALTPEQQAIYEGNGASTWGATTNNSHGSQVAGIIGARGLDGVMGVAPGANLVSVKVFDNSGSNFTSKTICGLAWIVANRAALGIDVVNMSLVWPTVPGPCNNDPNHQAVCNVVAAGLPLVAANGNLGTSGPMNAYPELIAVTAFNDWDGRPGGLASLRPGGCSSSQANTADDQFATYNQAGGSDYMAPGSCIWSTTTTGYAFNTGTSFAAPHVTGAIALFAASNPSSGDAAARGYLNANSVPSTDPAGLVGAGDGSLVLHLGPSPITGSINPPAAAPSAKVDYTVNGFPANATVSITWEKAAGGTINMGTVQANANGEASGQLTVPDTAPGGPGQRIVFTSGEYTKSFLFETRPRIRIHETTAVPGQLVNMNGRGFAANDQLRVFWRNSLNQFVQVGTVTTNGNGNFTNYQINVPSWAPPGPNTVRMEGVLNQNTGSLVIISPGVQIAPERTTVNNWITFDLSNFPPASPVTITWTRLTGSTIAIETDPDLPPVQTDEAGNAEGRFRVPATPGGLNQIITFTAGGVSETVLFDVAPRIKSNTNPGLRGGTIDFSLRGFARQENFIVRWLNPATQRWVTVGSGRTSNTGSANVDITVPLFAPDGDNKVRAESPSFNQQTNVVNISGGAPLQTAGSEPTPVPEPTATPEPIPTTVDSSALPFEAPLTIAEITDDARQPNLRFNLTDGQLATGWSAAPGIERNDARLTIELGGLHVVSGLAWLTETGGCGQLLQVEYSTDGQTWLPVDPYLIPGEIADPMVWRYFAAGVEATHLRISIGQAELNQNPLGCIAEVAVWGTAVAVETPTPEPVPTEPAPTPTTEPSPPAEEPTVEPAGDSDAATSDQSG